MVLNAWCVHFSLNYKVMEEMEITVFVMVDDGSMVDIASYTASATMPRESELAEV